ncbi:MAG TPA: hypothetical protein VL418_14290 [Devosiaceae bacterium]|nr:hypothetical protein [Devosiaceae bacterium]
MVEVYRGHEIVMLEGNPKSAVIVERRSGAPLPTKITALPQEEEDSCLVRARRLVDLYLAPRPAALSVHDQFRT